MGLTLALLAGGRGLGQTLPAGAQLLAQDASSRAEALLATAPWSAAGGVAADRVAGAVTTASWQIPATGLSTLDLGQHWRAELVAEGFTPGFACVAADCGGFDFRFAIPVLPEPDMHVDLGDFRYMTFRRDGPLGAEHRAVLISRGAGALYAQITTVLPAPPAKAPTARPPGAEPLAQADAAPVAPEAAPPGIGLIALLTGQGRAVLEDLDFASGAADLSPGDYASLDALGEWLAANPAARVTLVGHTDATGGLAANLALSLRRAQSVRERIASRHDLAAGQVEAEGIGFLAPRASNLTAEGQALNRRVEVVLTQAP
ncbi:MAG: OmpA family protein [Paracoccaceae bacterium]